MGPTIVRYALTEPPEAAIWTDGEAAAQGRSFVESVAEIGRHSAEYEELVWQGSRSGSGSGATASLRERSTQPTTDSHR